MPVKHLCTEIDEGKASGRSKGKENHFINPDAGLFFCPFPGVASRGESILQMTAVHQWLYPETISVASKGKQRGVGEAMGMAGRGWVC